MNDKKRFSSSPCPHHAKQHLSSEAWPQLLEDEVSIRKSDINVTATKCLIATSRSGKQQERVFTLHLYAFQAHLRGLFFFTPFLSAKLCPALHPCHPILANTVGAQGELITQRKWSTTPRGRPFFWDADTEKYTGVPSP